MNAKSMAAEGYAGDLSPSEAYRLLEQDPAAVLIDVRTKPEWQYVGVPALQSLGRDTLFLSWQEYPEMRQHSDFAGAVAAQGVGRDQPVLLLCRSGVRSRSAAIALTAAGYRQAYNVSEGFEGTLDSEGHRGTANGWRKAGLPWKQQ
jgi:rhodanese-related sulfurtransferase